MNDQNKPVKVDKLISSLREIPLDTRKASLDVYDLCIAAADRLANDQTHIAALQKEIEKLRSGRRWIPVTERLPENGRKVLCWGEYFRYGDFNAMFADYALGYQFNGSWGGEVTNGTKARALAWMPLPEAPEVE